MFVPTCKRDLAGDILAAGGDIVPLVVSADISGGWSQTNPSILVSGGEVLANIRCVEYTLIHSDKEQKYWSRWGPLHYAHAENLMALRTFNVLCLLDPVTLEVQRSARIDTSLLDTPPAWTFHGLEDCRLARWDGRLYGIGVRRDVKESGEGRMQYQEIDYSFSGTPYAREVRRNRIEPPLQANTYCEKNWMPILDMPHHFVKWTNPTEVVRADLEKNEAVQVAVSGRVIPGIRDLRGGSQVIRWSDGWLALTHECVFTSGNNEHGWKDAYYFSRFVQWDSNWNIIAMSDEFSFLDGRIEFVSGLDHLDEDFVVITFGFCDVGAYTVKMPKNMINELLKNKF
jgi:hypothetical protein